MSYNIDIFNNFIQTKVLPLYIPYPGRYSILIIDNAKIYKSQIQKA